MEYKFLDNTINTEDIVLPESDRINKYLLKNHYSEAVKGLDFLASEDKFLYVHGFLGTGKRQFINYISGFRGKDVIVLEYYCKPSTVCDDILLSFIDKIEKNSLHRAISQTAKITTLAVKFQQYLSSIKKPFLIILHSFDDIQEENIKLVSGVLSQALALDNIKIILSTRAMLQDVLGDIKIDKKIFLKAFSKEIFKEFAESLKISGTETSFEDFYNYTRGYYYYEALTIKIVQAMKISLNDFLNKFSMSEMTYDAYLGHTYLNLIPNTIRNFFWFLRFIRHGISANALAVFDLYDEFSIGYLKNNLMVFQSDDMIYVQDYFQQDIDISIPSKTAIKLHKYIINIYEKELKQSLQEREILISRQALRSEIEYHTSCIKDIEENKSGVDKTKVTEIPQIQPEKEVPATTKEQKDINIQMKTAHKLHEEKKYTEAIEKYIDIINEFNLNSSTLAEVRINIARVYKDIEQYTNSQHYYELAEVYYKQNDENINLNYLYYELTQLYFAMYKNERATETIKKVIYSVDTPQSLMVDACLLLGNIYSEQKESEEANKYYKKALESVDENTSEERKAELYFKYALTCDDMDDFNSAYEYYSKCVSSQCVNPYKALAYSNMGSCYYDNGNTSDALYCFKQAYDIEKSNNNYDGIYYTASHIAKIYLQIDSDKAYEFMIEAKQSAEFINEDFYIIEASVTLGDYYYNKKGKEKKALTEYFKARRIAQSLNNIVDSDKIEERIRDMQKRMPQEDFDKIEHQYG